MKTSYTFLFCTIIVAVIEVTNADITPPENLKLGNEATLENEVSCVCPADPILDTEEPVLNFMKRRFVNNLMNNSAMEFEGDQVPMRDVVLKMVQSDVPRWHHAAFVNTVWLANYLLSLKQTPNLGSFAQIINASVAWETSKDQKAMSDALDELAYILHNYVTVGGDCVIRAAGCSVQTPAKFREHPSSELAYSIDKAWEIGGDMMPSAYEKAAKALYNSPSYKDRLMAIMATLSITNVAQDFARHFNKELVTEFLFRAYTAPIPKCCCSAFIEKMKKSSTSFRAEALKVTRDMKNKWSIA